MDAWTEDQLRRMHVAGGNEACHEFLCHHGSAPQLWVVPPTTEKKTNNNSSSSSSSNNTTRRQVIQQKYDSPQGHFYQQVLKARLEGIPEPTQMPPPTLRVPTTTTTNSKYTAIRGGRRTKKPSKMDGFGSSPHPSEGKKARRRRRSSQKIMFWGAGAAALLG